MCDVTFGICAVLMCVCVCCMQSFFLVDALVLYIFLIISRNIGVQGFSMGSDVLTADFIRQAHLHLLSVFAWTVSTFPSFLKKY